MSHLIVAIALVVAVCAVSLVLRRLANRRHSLGAIATGELAGVAGSGANAVVMFTSPYCHGCRLWQQELTAAGIEPVTIDIAQRPDAAARYRISSTPRIAVVRRSDGTVLRDVGHYTPRAHDVDAVVALAGG